MPATDPSDRNARMATPAFRLLVEDELLMAVFDAAALSRLIDSAEPAVVYVEGEAIVGDAEGGTVKVERWRTLPC